MVREKGVASFSANFEAQKSAPIDARMIVDTQADLLLEATWTANDGFVYVYKGMLVTVHSDSTPENNGIYRLLDIDYTDLNNWEKIGMSIIPSINTYNFTGSQLSGSNLETSKTGIFQVSLEREILHPTIDYTIVGSIITFNIFVYDLMNITIWCLE